MYGVDDTLDDEDVLGNNNNSSKVFVQTKLAMSLLDDESEYIKETKNMPMMRKDYKEMNRKLNMLLQHGKEFSSITFQPIMTVHETTMKEFAFE